MNCDKPYSSVRDIDDDANFVFQAILEFFRKFVDSVGSKLEFVVDDITTGDPRAAGLTWHLGKGIPLNYGVSFWT